MLLGLESPGRRTGMGSHVLPRVGWRRQGERAVLVRCTKRFAVGAAYRTQNGFVVLAGLVPRDFPPMSVRTRKELGHGLIPRMADPVWLFTRRPVRRSHGPHS